MYLKKKYNNNKLLIIKTSNKKQKIRKTTEYLNDTSFNKIHNLEEQIQFLEIKYMYLEL